MKMNLKLSTLNFMIFGILLTIAGGVKTDHINASKVLKGNAIEVNNQTYVLNGAVVPVSIAKCISNNKTWPCGAKATLRLNELIQAHSIRCESIQSSAELPLARCYNSSSDIASVLVMEGWALVANDSSDYQQQENLAKKQQNGIWRGRFNPPADWRTYPSIAFDPIKDLLCSTCAVRNQ